MTSDLHVMYKKKLIKFILFFYISLIFYRLIKGAHLKHLDFFEQNLLINLETIFSLNWTNPKSHKN